MYSSERKKYNYLQTSSSSYIPTRSRRQPQQPLSTLSSLNNQNMISIQSLQLKSQIQPKSQKPLYSTTGIKTISIDNNNKIFELENINKKLLEDTAEQFKKFQGDIVRVEGILKIKEETVDKLQKQNQKLKQDKTELIQALKQKEFIIQEFQAKFKQLLNQKQNKQPISVQQISSQTSNLIPKQSKTQTDLFYTFPKDQSLHSTSNIDNHAAQQYSNLVDRLQSQSQKYKQQKQRSQKLTEQVYKLKQQLYEVSSELGVVKQQFQSYKLLYEIQMVRNS